MLTAVERKWRFPTPGHQRVLKLRGDAQQIFVNGEFSGGSSGFWDYTIYVNPYMVVRPEGHYTKHIYVNSQHIASKIGNPEDYEGGDPTVPGSSVGKKVMLEEVVEENFTELFGSIPDIEAAVDTTLGMSDGGSGGEPHQYWFTADHQVSLPLNKYRKVAVDFCSDQGARKEYSLSYTTDEQRRYEQKDQDLVCLNVVVMTLSSSAFVTDASGVAIQHLEIDRREIREPPLKLQQGREQYMAFGEVFVDERRTGFGTPYKFNAKELDCESGYYYYMNELVEDIEMSSERVKRSTSPAVPTIRDEERMLSRYYDPRMARFLSVDPLAAEFPSWTPYHYVHNNPLRYTDPTGMSADDIIDIDKKTGCITVTQAEGKDVVRLINNGEVEASYIYGGNGSFSSDNSIFRSEGSYFFGTSTLIKSDNSGKADKFFKFASKSDVEFGLVDTKEGVFF